jgi:ABC-type sulfate/molybdate transport systems ATPase subunit
MPQIELKHISNFACRGTNFTVRDGELLAIVGPNGAGKTTLLNVIAGLIPYEGSVLFNGVPVDSLPARMRGVGYVFQDLALFPHLDVKANIAYGLNALGHVGPEVDMRVDQMLHLLALSHLSSRHPVKLSGGEKQRVALARALAPRPKLLLLDEPFNSLDSQTRRALMSELRALQQSLHMTTFLVTHDPTEVETLADRVALLRAGRIELVRMATT